VGLDALDPLDPQGDAAAGEDEDEDTIATTPTTTSTWPAGAGGARRAPLADDAQEELAPLVAHHLETASEDEVQDDAHHHLDAAGLAFLPVLCLAAVSSTPPGSPTRTPSTSTPRSSTPRRALAEDEDAEHLDAHEDAAADRGELDTAGELAPARGCASRGRRRRRRR
jgi:hypothetical protein